MERLRFWAASLLCVWLVGCSSTQGYPNRSLSAQTEKDKVRERLVRLHEVYFETEEIGRDAQASFQLSSGMFVGTINGKDVSGNISNGSLGQVSINVPYYAPKVFGRCLLVNNLVNENLYTLTSTNSKKLMGCRNELINGRLEFYNVLYGEFIREINSESQTTSTTLSSLSIISGVGGALASSGDVSQIWSGVSAGFTGLNSTINKSLYYDQTMPSMILLMDANRAEFRTRIIKGMREPYENYNLAMALDDLESYYMAGSVPGAIARMSKVASESKDVAVDNEQQVIQEVYTSSDLLLSIEDMTAIADTFSEGQMTSFLTEAHYTYKDLQFMKKNFPEAAYKQLSDTELRYKKNAINNIIFEVPYESRSEVAQLLRKHSL